MRTTLRHLLHLPVVTVGGVRLGRVRDAEVDAESHLIVTYRVNRWLRPSLVIHRTQVVEVRADRLIVDDGVIKTAAAVLETEPTETPLTSPAAAPTVNAVDQG